VGAFDTALELLDTIAVMNGVQEAGNQIKWIIKPEFAHIPNTEDGFRATLLGYIQHGLINIQPFALVTEVQEMPDVRPGATGQIQMTPAAIAK
jgi:hypothetical protein